MFFNVNLRLAHDLVGLHPTPPQAFNYILPNFKFQEITLLHWVVCPTFVDALHFLKAFQNIKLYLCFMISSLDNLINLQSTQ